jgi:acid phosphatase type 7
MSGVTRYRAVARSVAGLLLGLALSSLASAASTVLFVVGDIADCRDGARQVSAAILRDPEASRGWLFEVGDLAYPIATRKRLLECHEPHFGPDRFPRRLAVPGNHDADDPGLAGFHSLYPEALPRQVDFGRWRVLMLDSNRHGESGGRQRAWIAQAISASAGHCLIAAWHHPAWTSGIRGDNPDMKGLWSAVAGAASFTLHGHDHHYERLAPRDAKGQLSAAGTASFISGNGGTTLYALAETVKEGSVAVAGEWGYLRIELDDQAYRWQAVGVSGRLFDQGQGACRSVR